MRRAHSSYFILIVLLMGYTSATGQTNPVDQWTFAGQDWASSTRSSARVQTIDLRYDRQTEGRCNYISLKPDQETGFIVFKKRPGNLLSLSFWIRIPEGMFPEADRLFWTMDYGLYLRLNPGRWLFQTSVIDRNGEIHKDQWTVRMDGAGFDSYDYLVDGNWHQITIQYDSRSGKKEFYVDGQTKDSWTKVVDQRGTMSGIANGNPSLAFSNQGNERYEGDLAMVSLYSTFRSQNDIRRAYVGETGSLGIQPRTREVSTRDTEEVAALSEYPELTGSLVTSAERQLSSFPRPRYYPGHTLLPNFNWIDPYYMSGYRLNTNSQDEALQTLRIMLMELWTDWEYSLPLSWVFANQYNAGQGSDFGDALINLANSRPDLPVGLTTGWAHIRTKNIGMPAGTKPRVADLTQQTAYYAQTEDRQFITHNGELQEEPALYRPGIPTSLWATDGQWQKQSLESLLSRLTRPVNIVNENGEVPPWPVDEEVLSLDPVIRAHYEQGGYTSYEQMYSVFKTEMRSTYRDGFMSHPKLKNAIFSWYAIDGGPYNLDRFHWTEAKTAMSPIDGSYYSTPNFYVRWPENWEKWRGPWRGWEWISISRKVEIADGDRFFSPFVGAGWARDPQKNVRPSQWLGLLKCLNVVGAEFFYTGVFHERGLQFFPLPQNYIWQISTPSYAQAVLSRYEDIFRDGDLLLDAAGVPITEYDAGDPRILFTARKHNARAEYILAGTIQPNSNTPGNVPDVVMARPTVDGMNLILPVRRQGSVYHLDLTNPSQPILRQLDAWHQAGHPSHWEIGFRFEAEVADYVQDCQYRTSGNQGYDFSNTQTVLTPNGEDPCSKYQFVLTETTNLDLDIRARSIGGSGTIQVMLGDELLGQMTVSPSTEFQTLTFKNRGLRSLPAGTHLLALHFEGSGLEIDHIHLH